MSKQMSTWRNFEDIDTDTLFDLFKKAAAEAVDRLKAGCPSLPMGRRSRPTTFSITAAGVISVAERQAYIGRVRDSEGCLRGVDWHLGYEA